MLLTSATASADLVKLMNGGEIRGRLLKNASGRAAADTVTLETLSGVTIVVDRADLQFVTMRPLVVEEYETRSKRIPNTLDAHWDLSEWCRSHSLSKQREHHLQKVVEHDPHHEKAQLALGRVWNEGAWVDRDEMMAARGYVKYKGRYVTVQELDLIQKTAAELATERDWYQKLKLWRGWISGTNEDKSRQALAALQDIEDPHAAAAVIKYLCEDNRRDMRSLGVRILSKITGAKGTGGLVKLSLFDPDDDIRYASLQGIAEDDFETAQTVYIKELRHSLNVIVLRAAIGLSRVGDHRSVSHLIDALVTTHRYQVQTNVPAIPSYGANTDGSMAMASGSLPPEVEIAMRTGQLPQGAIVLPPNDGTANIPRKMTVVTVDQQNREVLSTLQQLTGQNFGFDERTWRLWWAAEKNIGGGLPGKN